MSRTLNILVANGVNLDLLGRREVQHYGNFNLKDLEREMWDQAAAFKIAYGLDDIILDFFQSNDECKFLEKISSTKAQGIIINPGAWSHTSIALSDRLAVVAKPYIEVHISNLSRREEFRQKSYCSPGASGVIYGLGLHSYLAGLFAIVHHLCAKPS